jgi:hypothetical protein
MQLYADLKKNERYEELLSLIDHRFGGDCYDFGRYQADPVAFGEEVLGETYTEGIKAMLQSVRDNPFTVMKSANAVGKSHGAARAAVWFYKCFPGSQVYTAAAPPESNLKKILWGEIGSIVEKHSELFKNDEVTALHVQRGAQSFLTGVTIPTSGSTTQREAKFAGKHAPYLFFIVDESDAVPDEVFAGIESCMSGGWARLLCMLNPRAPSGAVYRWIRDGRAKVITLSAFSHPNVIEGRDVIPGAVDREVTVRRVNEWARLLAAGEKSGADTFLLPAFLEGDVAKSRAGIDFPPLKAGHYKIMDPAFSYMVLGEFPAQGANQLISKEWIDAARLRWNSYVDQNGERPPMMARPLAGLDVAEFGADSNVLIFRSAGYVTRPVSWSGMDLSQTAVNAAEICKEYRASRVMVDSIGVGAAMPGMVTAQGMPAVGVKTSEKATVKTEAGEFHRLRDQLWWSVREWLRTDPGAMLPPDEGLIEELTIPTYEIENGKIRVMKKDTMRELLGRSPDRADSLCLTFSPSNFFSDCSFPTF